MSVAIYARVSTANNGQDPTMQTRELREYAERRGWALAAEYVDVGISGTKEKRPELDRLMADAHRQATRNRGRSQDWRAPRFWFLMGGNHPSNGLDERDGTKSLLCAESVS